MKIRSFEPQNIIKKQEVRPQNLTSVQCGWKTGDETEQKSAQIYYMFINHRSEILSMKEQVQLIRGVLAA